MAFAGLPPFPRETFGRARRAPPRRVSHSLRLPSFPYSSGMLGADAPRLAAMGLMGDRLLDWLRRIIEDPRTERIIMALIVFNAMTLGIETSQA